MNTSELVRQLASQLNITQLEAKRLLQQELAAISAQLGAGNDVIVRGFGKFSLRESTASKTRGPQTTVSFKAAQKLRDFISGWKPS